MYKRQVVSSEPAVCAAADLLVLPGSRATVSDLAWMRSRGLDAVVAARHDAGRPTLGICGGFEMLAGTIDDDVESGAGLVRGLGVLPVDVRFAADKVTRRSTHQWRGLDVPGYEIHHGVCLPTGPAEPFLDGVAVGATFGTMLHGALEGDAFRLAFLAEVADLAGRDWRPSARCSRRGSAFTAARRTGRGKGSSARTSTMPKRPAGSLGSG